MTQFIEGVDNEVIPSRTLFNKEKKLVFDPAVYERNFFKSFAIFRPKKQFNPRTIHESHQDSRPSKTIESHEKHCGIRLC